MPALPLALGWAAAVGLAFADGRRRGAGWVAVAALAAMLAALCGLLAALPADGTCTVVSGGWPAGIGIALRADLLGTLFAAVAVAVLLAAAAFQVLRGVEERSFPSLVLFLALGLCGVFLTGDAFNFYVFFEVSMVSSFALAAYGTERRELRAASIFMIVNLLGSALFLGAVVALYRVHGTLDLVELAAAGSGAAVLTMPAVLLLAAFALKLGLFPFHYWVPSVYVGTRPAVAAMLAGALANIGVYGLLRFGAEVLPDQLAGGRLLLSILGCTTVVYGALLAVSRRKAPEVLAYASVSQGGYLLIAIGIGGRAGYAAAVLYTIVNSLDKAVLFLAAGDGTGGRAARGFALGALSVAGVPPLAGFVAKLGMFRAAFAADSFVLAAVLFLGSALSFVYMFQGYQHVFWARRGGQPAARPARRVRRAHAVTLALGLLLVAFGIWPEPLLAASERIAAGLAEAER